MVTAQEVLYSMVWNNPWNVYAMFTSTPKQTAIGQLVWSVPPAVGYGTAVYFGMQTAGYVSPYAVPTLLGLSPMKNLYIFAAVSAASMVYDVHTNPETERQLQAGLKNPGSNRDIMKMMSFGPVT